MKKYSDLENKEQNIFSDQLTANVKKLGIEDAWDGGLPADSNILADVGLCKKCKDLRAYRQKYGTESAYCYRMRRLLNPADPVVSCSEYEDRFIMSIWDMQQLAVIIDLEEKNEIGFKK